MFIVWSKKILRSVHSVSGHTLEPLVFRIKSIRYIFLLLTSEFLKEEFEKKGDCLLCSGCFYSAPLVGAFC